MKMWKHEFIIDRPSCIQMPCALNKQMTRVYRNIQTSMGWRICPKDTGSVQSMLNLMLNI